MTEAETEKTEERKEAREEQNVKKMTEVKHKKRRRWTKVSAEECGWVTQEMQQRSNLNILGTILPEAVNMVGKAEGEYGEI